MTQERLLRREFLAVLSALPSCFASRGAQLSLLPLSTPREHNPVDRSLVNAAAAALTRVYTVGVIVRAPERYEGSCEAEALLDYLAGRAELTMAVIGTPLRALARTGFWSAGRNVSGIGDLPTDQRERPRGSIITTYEIAGHHEVEQERWLGIVAIHEFGHNLGAWDCNDRGCYMHYDIEIMHGSTPHRFCAFHEGLLERALRPAQHRRE